MKFLRTDDGALDRDLVASSGLFDELFYALQLPDAGDCGTDLVEHYLKAGWKQGIDPSPHFSTIYYLDTNHDVSALGMNPLLHYILYGKKEGRLPRQIRIPPAGETTPLAVAPTPDEWEDLLASLTVDQEPEIDVIIPVYRGYDETSRCLYSVLSARQATEYRLVVVNDCSPEQRISELLRYLAERNAIELHVNGKNKGFVKTCNYAMGLHPECDIVLLNSDTEVFSNWLDRLKDAALSDSAIGTVTPFSNNAEICSYPKFIADNWNKLEIGDAELDQLAARVNGGQYIDIPTGIGFCMYVRRICVETVGLLNEEKFDKGYGEENDLCRRITAAGWRNIIAPNIFVRHYGATSFGASKAALIANATKTMELLHPGYSHTIAEFIATDPIRPFREALDIARLNQRSDRGTVLFVMHRWGGGTERHLHELASNLERDGIPVIFCRMHSSDPNRICLEYQLAELMPNLSEFDVRRDMESFIRYLQTLQIVHVHIHHLAGFPRSGPDFFRLVCDGARLSYDFTVHDYMSVCPRINLIDHSDIYCAEPDAKTCETCILRNGSPFGHPVVWEWRDAYFRLLRGARRIFVPDIDVAQRMSRFFPSLEYTLRPHEMVRVNNELPSINPIKKRQNARVAILGAIGPHKGSLLLEAVAKACVKLGLSLEFAVIGYTDRDLKLASIDNVTCTGPYEEKDAELKLLEANADIIWFPSVCPETYSYTLSTAFLAGVYPVGFDFGAVGSRIRDQNWGEVIPIELMLFPDDLAKILLRIARSDKPLKPKIFSEVTYTNTMATYYGLEPIQTKENKEAVPFVSSLL
ncbi:glycosyltransferase [Phyllobacterium myrsinacearum]|uniref:Glycosyltransferase n=1 Tax=Phyllobacterium myrsinacearum TaxID=28101 RepID=A0A2S9JIW0_9HYPH|nr:glycosyltransferase [Phyllobacterium myrsinacearum]PRD52905.1 glycosyltransferase [Phyllobacterium myrsinacearum]PWV94603.1 GT2 family glycosyltransferase [Phyllobacterium myrsinacearum]RZV07288.1 GT2 family glycosyltransferase [Phyllobacterium myrsinacearum]